MGVEGVVPATGAAHQPRRRILVVDDEPIVRQFLTTAIHQMGYEAIPAGDGLQAQDLFHWHASELALIWVELALPRMNGAQFIRTLPTLEPRIPVVFTSGRGEREPREGRPGPVLSKPFGAADMRRIFRHVVPISGLTAEIDEG
jgi:two-component system cell cycle sensor histidine kinase/response regulator CckA